MDSKNGKDYYTTPGVYYRTGKGTKAHSSSTCANQRRSIFTGDILTIPTAELTGWSGCQHCCDAQEIAYLAAAKIVPAAATCPNSGVVKPGRIYSTCRDCGKDGKVNSSTGRIRAHKPIVK